MKADAKFERKEGGFWYGKTRRGKLVKIRATEKVEQAIATAWGAVITVATPDEVYDRAKPSEVIEVVYVPFRAEGGQP